MDNQGFVDLSALALSSVEARKLAEPGVYTVKILSVSMKQSANTGRNYVNVACNIEGGKYITLFQKYFLPMESDDEGMVDRYREELAMFCDGFGIARDAFLVQNFPAYKGMTGQWHIGVVPAKDGFPESNKLVKPV